MATPMIYEMYCTEHRHYVRNILKMVWLGYKEAYFENNKIKGTFRRLGDCHMVIIEKRPGELKEHLFKESTILREINPGIN